MRLGQVVETKDGSEIRKAQISEGTRFFAWSQGATVGVKCHTLTQARLVLLRNKLAKKQAA